MLPVQFCSSSAIPGGDGVSDEHVPVARALGGRMAQPEHSPGSSGGTGSSAGAAKRLPGAGGTRLCCTWGNSSCPGPITAPRCPQPPARAVTGPARASPRCRSGVTPGLPEPGT